MNDAKTRPSWLPALLLAAVTLLAYGRAWQAGFIWDDDAYVTQNRLLTAPDGLRLIWFSLQSPSQYFPLTYTSFYFEHALWGLNPAGYHLVNIVLHAANAILLWRLLERLRAPGAWLAAGFFALHPVQVESVAWITERKNVLMAFFYFLAVREWLRFIDEKTNHRWRRYALALFFFGLSLSAKTTACTLPVALLLVLWLKRWPIGWARLAQIAPFMLMGAGMGLVSIWWEQNHQGTQGKLFEMAAGPRLLLACRALWFYLGKLLWPVNLTFSYPRWTISDLDLGWVVATAAVAGLIWRLRRWTGRGVAVAALFFVVTLGPVLGLFMLYTFQYSFVADHYQYLACIGPLALAAAGLELAEKRFVMPHPVLIRAVLLMALGTLTWRQCQIYSSPETLWRATLQHNPTSWLANNDLAILLRQKGHVDQAIVHYELALESAPGNDDIHVNLARALQQKGRSREAILQYDAALRLQPVDLEVQNNLAWILATSADPSLRKGPRAVQLASQANDLAGGKNAIVLGTLAAALAETGQFTAATQTVQQAIALAAAARRQNLVARLSGQLQLYRAGHAFHE